MRKSRFRRFIATASVRRIQELSVVVLRVCSCAGAVVPCRFAIISISRSEPCVDMVVLALSGAWDTDHGFAVCTSRSDFWKATIFQTAIVLCMTSSLITYIVGYRGEICAKWFDT